MPGNLLTSWLSAVRPPVLSSLPALAGITPNKFPTLPTMFPLSTPRFSLRACGVSVFAGALMFAGGIRSLHAGAFALSDQSSSAIATSFAGAAALAEDPGTVFFNPAGMAFLDGIQTESDYTYIHPHAEFDNHGSAYSFGAPVSGSDGGGAGRGATISATYLTATVLKNENYGQLTLGIGITVPFGLVVDYDPNWVGRYNSLRSDLRTIDYGFSAAYRWKFISIGGGFDAQYSSAVLTQAIDFGLLGFARGIPGFAPGKNDGILRLEGSDVSYGFNVGGIVEYLQPGQVPLLGKGRLGVSYRSGITQDYTGEISFRRVPLLFKSPLFGGAFDGQQGRRAVASAGDVQLRPSRRKSGSSTFWLALPGRAGARLSDIPINFSNPASQAALVSDPTLGHPGINNQFVDAFRYTGGFEYQATKDLLLRFGAGYDETPVPNAQLRPSRIPDGDRILLSCGLKYHAASFKSPIFNHTWTPTWNSPICMSSCMTRRLIRWIRPGTRSLASTTSRSTSPTSR